MCELLGMNCNVPTDICFSFRGFQQRGGGTGVHRDGWGIAFFEGKGARVFLDPEPSVNSAIAELVSHYPIRSRNVIAHIRKATHGSVRLENTHPFMRELWGHHWIFAHNGKMPDFYPELNGQFLPVGDTDSERVFCWLLQNLRSRFGNVMPPRIALLDALWELTNDLANQGILNFLLSNGDCLFAHCSEHLHYLVRRAPFSVAHLKDQDVSVDFNELTRPNDSVVIVATQPLTDNESWHKMPAGTLWLFSDGEPIEFLGTHPAIKV